MEKITVIRLRNIAYIALADVRHKLAIKYGYTLTFSEVVYLLCGGNLIDYYDRQGKVIDIETGKTKPKGA